MGGLRKAEIIMICKDDQLLMSILQSHQRTSKYFIHRKYLKRHTGVIKKYAIECQNDRRFVGYSISHRIDSKIKR